MRLLIHSVSNYIYTVVVLFLAMLSTDVTTRNSLAFSNRVYTVNVISLSEPLLLSKKCLSICVLAHKTHTHTNLCKYSITQYGIS